jgi:demethylmenaquinone methyltransferase/2-methoxy-6-polyprenyl-1,4-benzoquinol methylase
MDTEELIAAQIAYYRARAVQYDRELKLAAVESSSFMKRFERDVAELEGWLAADPPTGHVLEIAAGSGNRTAQLLRWADRVTAVDAAPEMLELLASKHHSVECIVADIFTWEPPQRYDNIFFGYWFTHVPAARWDGFWDLVGRALLPGGQVWFLDNAHPQYTNSRGPGDWPVVAGLRLDDDVHSEIQTRPLLDGSQWTLVKRFWWPTELVADLRRMGWLATADHTAFAFIYGTAQRL